MVPLERREISSTPIARRHRNSFASVRTMGLFGLGGAEIAIVLVAAAFLLGPETLAKMTKEAGKVASEYKDELEKVPDEFKKGYDEAQIDSKSRKAKPMERLPDEK